MLWTKNEKLLMCIPHKIAGECRNVEQSCHIGQVNYLGLLYLWWFAQLVSQSLQQNAHEKLLKLMLSA